MIIYQKSHCENILWKQSLKCYQNIDIKVFGQKYNIWFCSYHPSLYLGSFLTWLFPFDANYNNTLSPQHVFGNYCLWLISRFYLKLIKYDVIFLNQQPDSIQRNQEAQ